MLSFSVNRSPTKRHRAIVDIERAIAEKRKEQSPKCDVICKPPQRRETDKQQTVDLTTYEMPKGKQMQSIGCVSQETKPIISFREKNDSGNSSMKNTENVKSHATGDEYYFRKIDRTVNIISETNDGNIIVFDKESNRLIWCTAKDLDSC